MSARTLLLILFALALAAGCGGGEREQPSQSSATFREPTAGPPATTPPGPSATVALCPAHAPGDFDESFESSFGERTYRLHIPPGYGARPLPLVLSFHGYSQTSPGHEAYTRMGFVADREGFILVTPQARGNPSEWQVPGIYDGHDDGDIEFTSGLLDTLESTLCIDAARIYATGFSNGAEMASQVACRLGDRIAAFAPVAGVVYQGCDGPPVALISLHGTSDFNVPFDYAPPAMEAWARHNGCSPEPAIEQLTANVRVEEYAACQADTRFYAIEGGGHTWPDAEDNAGGAGPTTHEINANEVIWAFFMAHPRLD